MQQSLDLTNPKQLKALLERHGLQPKKRFGQHFLISPRVIDAMLARLDGVRGVLEVGPGPGVLTAALSERVERLIGVEIDPVCVSALAESAPSAEVYREDALMAPLTAYLEGLPTPCALLSNMPYNITGPLLARFIEAKSTYVKAVLMMQKEVGERIMAKAGDSNRGALSVYVQAQFNLETVCKVPATAFFPQPKVESIVLELTPLESEIDAGFNEFVHKGFSQPRKTLVNNLGSSYFPDKARLQSILNELGFSAHIRPHQLHLEDWRILWNKHKN